jgi:hypothetical protein
LAKRFNAQCIETSAKQRVNVDEAFIAVVRAIRRYQKVSYVLYEMRCKLTCRNPDHLKLPSSLVKQQPEVRVDDRMRNQPMSTTRDVVVDV